MKFEQGQNQPPLLGNPSNRADVDGLMSVVYEELRSIAARLLHQERSNHTLQPTALVHEVYLQLASSSSLEWNDRSHFLAIASKCVRRVLVNHARKSKAAKRGGSEVHLTLHDIVNPGKDSMQIIDVLALEELLCELGGLNERQMRVVELRYYGGLTVPEAAHVLDVSTRTIECDWALARAWLAERLLPAG